MKNGYRHAVHYLTLAEKVDADFRGAGTPLDLEPVRCEQNNLRAALRWAVDKGQSELALRLAGVMTNLWEGEGLFTEGLTWSQRAVQLAQGERPTPAMLKALWYCGYLALGLGNLPPARAAFQQCLLCSRHLQHEHWKCRALTMLASVAYYQGNYAEMHTLDVQRLRVDRSAQGDWTFGMFLNHLGGRLARLGQFSRARHYIEEGLAILNSIQNRYGRTLALLNLGNLRVLEGNYADAYELIEEAKRSAEETGHSGNYAGSISLLAWLAIAKGKHAEAKALASEALQLFDSAGQKIRLAETIDLFAALSLAQERAGKAVRLASAAGHLRKTLGVVLPPVEQKRFDRVLKQALERLDAEDAAAAQVEGKAMTTEEVVKCAME